MCCVGFPSIGVCLLFFSWADRGYGFGDRKPVEVKYYFYHIVSKIRIITWFITVDVDLDHLAEVFLSAFSTDKILPHFPHFTFWKEFTMCVAHTYRGVTPPPPLLQAEYLHKLFGNILDGRFVSSPLLIHLFKLWQIFLKASTLSDVSDVTNGRYEMPSHGESSH